jgi:hypothetical protein
MNIAPLQLGEEIARFHDDPRAFCRSPLIVPEQTIAPGARP